MRARSCYFGLIGCLFFCTSAQGGLSSSSHPFLRIPSQIIFSGAPLETGDEKQARTRAEPAEPSNRNNSADTKLKPNEATSKASDNATDDATENPDGPTYPVSRITVLYGSIDAEGHVQHKTHPSSPPAHEIEGIAVTLTIRSGAFASVRQGDKTIQLSLPKINKQSIRLFHRSAIADISRALVTELTTLFERS